MASIGDPFVLTTYALPKISARAGPSGLSNVFATNQYASTSSSEDYVTLAAQGDGVHILDLSTLHPAISYTLGPQVYFSCPSVTRTTVSGSSKICTTYAVIESAPDLSSDERGQTLWRWKEDPAGSVTAAEAQKRRISAKAPHKVFCVYAPDELPDHVILVGPDGEVTVTDEKLEVKTSSRPEAHFELLRSSVLPRQASPFGSGRSAGVVVITVGLTDRTVHARVVAVPENGVCELLGDFPIAIELSSSILDITLSNSGYLSILTASGTWHSFDLRSGGDTLRLPQAAEPVALTSLSFIPSASVLESPHQLEVAISSVGSSHVLLCGISPSSNSDITLLLWDLRYSVVLASQTYTIPSILGRSKKSTLEIRLVANPINPSQAILVLSPRPPKLIANGASEARLSSTDPSSRSVVLVIPLSVPAASKISNAIGRAADSAKWIAHSTTSDPSSNHDGPRAKVLRVMRTSMGQGRPQAADDGFFNWVKQEEGRLPKTPEGTAKNEVLFGYKFVQDILEIVFKQPKSVAENIPYSPKVVRYLLDRRAVSSGMVDGGLLPKLRLRKDWECMLLALKTVIDIPETDLLILLHDVIITRTTSVGSAGDDDPMQSEFTDLSSLPSLSDILALCATYPTSAAAMRVAIRKHLRDPDELVSVLEMLWVWVESWVSGETRFLPQETRKDEHGFLVPVVETHERENIPPLDKVLNFVQIILDSSFLTFLSHPPSQKLIRQIKACLQPELDLNDEIEQLQGPLQPFVRAQAKAVSDAINGPSKIDPKIDWRQRKKSLHEQAGVNVGLYQVEELML